MNILYRTTLTFKLTFLVGNQSINKLSFAKFQWLGFSIIIWFSLSFFKTKTFLLNTAAGSPGRHSLPNSRIMIHQPSGGVSGQATDICIHAEEILKMKKQLNKIYAHHTGKPLAEIEPHMERDKFMNPQEALEFGLIDKILTHPTDIASKQ